MKEFSVEDVISSMNGDKEFIEQRERERKERYKTAIELYKRSIENEQKVLEKSKVKMDERNNQFRQQISDLFLRYQSGVIKIYETERRLMKEKQQLNEFLIRVYPGLENEIKENLKKENSRIKDQLVVIEDEKKKKMDMEGEFVSFSNLYKGMENYDKVLNTRRFLNDNMQEIEAVKENYETNLNYLDQFSKKNFSLDRPAPRGLDDLSYNRRVQDYHKAGEETIDEIKRKRERVQVFQEKPIATEEANDKPQTDYLKEFMQVRGRTKPSVRTEEQFTDLEPLEPSHHSKDRRQFTKDMFK